MFSKLQYISQGTTIEEQLYNIHQALDNGCDWVQLRFKNGNSLELFTLAEAVKTLCEEYLATFIINDKVDLALQINADGVHLGLNDMRIKDARTLLGNHKIIGGTANTLEDVLQRTAENCDYIGLGPLRFTTTKENLSPILGLEGYRHILSKIEEQNIRIPVYAIGGIASNDIENLIDTGLHGIAVSGLITENPQLITQLNEKLYVNI
ncbi:thiamine phosphate synthase [Flavobacterium saliperosum]|uniref:Thiamine-phosphate synthase n=1 Tax=Flavobacterium saliperosum TaxID=329186 RepID=A0A1G4V860_9FLAO|nr:thiamine phosphate synthase [Flavobacterium saliperosum]SCX02716.1 thiamine-phosphate diphosphorylase [Flavobacterium saliperosum]